MAFDITNFDSVSAGQQVGANRIWWYSTISDTLSTVKGSGYFNTITDKLNQYDVLFIVASDGHNMLRVTSATGAATVTTKTYSGIGDDVLQTSFDDPDTNMNSFRTTVTVEQGDLASSGNKTLLSASGTEQYKFLDIFMNVNGTDFTGGGGDRDIKIHDGTTNFTVMPASSVQSLVNARWGDTAVPYPASPVDIDTATQAGADIIATYSGGSSDYSAGAVFITLILERIQ